MSKKVEPATCDGGPEGVESRGARPRPTTASQSPAQDQHEFWDSMWSRPFYPRKEGST
jgi:hypothetical protein